MRRCYFTLLESCQCHLRCRRVIDLVVGYIDQLPLDDKGGRRGSARTGKCDIFTIRPKYMLHIQVSLSYKKTYEQTYLGHETFLGSCCLSHIMTIYAVVSLITFQFSFGFVSIFR